MLKNLLTKAELARRLNVSRAYITQTVGRWPKGVLSGKLINTKHPIVAEFIEKKGGLGPPETPESVAAAPQKVKPKPKRPAATKAEPPATTEPPEYDHIDAEIPEDLREFRDHTLEQLLLKFGTHASFSAWLKSVKEIEMIEEKRLKNQQTRGGLVDVDLVDRVVDVFDTQHMRLLKDGAKSVTAEVISKHQAGVGMEEIEVFASKRMGTFITAAKERVKRLNAKGRSY